MVCDIILYSFHGDGTLLMAGWWDGWMDESMWMKQWIDGILNE